MTCQTTRYAGPRQPDSALIRTFESDATKRRPATTFVQAAQAARTERAARGSYDTAVDWFADCGDDRAQLLAARVNS